MRKYVNAAAAIIASAVVSINGCGGGIPSVDGRAGAPPSPSVAWNPPPSAVTHDSVPRARDVAALPPDLEQRISSLTLADVVDLTLRNNPATRESWSEARAAADLYGAARGAYFPSLSGTVTSSVSKSLAVSSRTTSQRTQYGPSVTLNYLLFDFGGRSGSVEEARQNLFVADFTHNATLQTTVLQAESAYFTYMATRGLLAAEQAAIAEEQANLKAAEGRHTVGLATIADVLQARTALSQEQLNLETIQGNLQAARGTLAAAMGIPANLPYDLQALPEQLPVRMVAETVDSLINEAVRNRPDLAAARANAAAARARVRTTRSLELPSLVLGSNAGRTYANVDQAQGSTYTLQLGLSIPIFNGFSYQYNTAAARELANAATARAEGTRQEVIAQVFTSYYQLQTAGQRVTTADDLLASATQSVQVAAGRYREGVGSIIDLLTAQTALANARAQQVQSRWQWANALAQLAHDSGVLGTRGQTPFSFADSARTDTAGTVH